MVVIGNAIQPTTPLPFWPQKNLLVIHGSSASWKASPFVSAMGEPAFPKPPCFVHVDPLSSQSLTTSNINNDSNNRNNINKRRTTVATATSITKNSNYNKKNMFNMRQST